MSSAIEGLILLHNTVIVFKEMSEITLSANKRNVLGKKVRFLRREGITPANIYGHGIESSAVQIDTASLKNTLSTAGTTSIINLKIKGDKNSKSVIIRDIQRHPLTGDLLHVDLYQVKMAEKIKLEVPLELAGESPAVRELDGIMIQNMSSVEVECLPANMPRSIEVDLATITEIDQSFHVSDLPISEDVTILTDPEKVILVVTGRRAMEIEEEVPEAEAEVEVVGEEEEVEKVEEEAPKAEAEEEATEE